MSVIRNFVLAITAVFVFGGTSALADDWRMREVSGVVRVTLPSRGVVDGTAGQVLPVGSSITTGGAGRAVVTNGDQRIVVGPSSRTTLAPEQNGVTRILQDLGSALYQVDRRTRPHFRVETPLLAAVVKGTTFTVSVDGQVDRVHVAEGLVEVRSLSGNGSSDVPAGSTASVTRDQPGAVNVAAPSAAATSVSAAIIEPIDYNTASGGLVENPRPVQSSLTAVVVPVSPTPSAARAENGSVGSVGNSAPSIARPGIEVAPSTLAGNLGNGGNTANGVGNSSSGGNLGSAGNGGNAGSGGGNPGSGGNPGNGGGNFDPGGNPGNGGGNPGNGGGNPGSGGNPGNGGGNPGNGGGDPGPGGNPGNGGGNPGNGGGDPGTGGNPGNGGGNPGNGGGNPGSGGNPGNGGGNPGNGGGNPGSGGNPGNGGGNPGNGGGDPGTGGNPGNGGGNAGNGGGSPGTGGNPGNGGGNPGTGGGNPGGGGGNPGGGPN